MGIFKFHFENKTNLILITSIIWAFTFRTTFKNINYHMGLGSYASLKFEPLLYLIKNIIYIFFFIGFVLEIKINKHKKKEEEIIVEKKEGNIILVSQEMKTINKNERKALYQVVESQNLYNKGKKILYCLKVFFMILFMCVVEDAYFICSNNHVIDRVICPIRNFSMIFSSSILSIIFMKKAFYRNKHQYIPFIIIFLISIGILILNFSDIERFKKKFSGLNMAVYMIIFFCMGPEMIFIKILLDNQYLSIFLIIGLKGIIGTIIFIIVYILFPQEQFFDIFDKNFNFEYEFLNESFSIYPKILYIMSLVALEYFKFFTINQFTENHITSCLMITDIIFFPIYCLERFAVQGFNISTPKSFWTNSIAGIINCLLMLIFNEILECNFWGLNSNLKINIDLRQKDDCLYNINEILSKRDSKSDEDTILDEDYRSSINSN